MEPPQTLRFREGERLGARESAGSVPDCEYPTVAIVGSDTSEGISDRMRRHLGIPYFTGERADDWKKGKGAGLGLSIGNGIMAAHGGTMFIASSPGRGTQLAVHLRICLSGAVRAQGRRQHVA